MDEITILDGSMGQELVRRGAAGPPEMWGAGALIEHPEVIRELHEEYIAAGADVITTNTYASSPHRMGLFGIPERFAELNLLACRLAQQARDASGREVRIAGSLGPTRGSYRPDLVAPYEVLLPEYRQMAELLAPHVDLLVCETMSTLDEARAAHDAAGTTGRPVWVAWTLENGGPDTLLSGESFAEAVAAVPAQAFLLNCTDPETTDAALPHLAAATDRPVGAYANAFTPIPTDWNMHEGDVPPPARTDLGPEQYAVHVKTWIDAGATIVGGCCEVGPAHIHLLHRSLR